MGYLNALAHIVILVIIVASLVSVIIMRRTEELDKAYVSVEAFLFALLTASIIDMPLYNNYAFFNMQFDKVFYDVCWHALCLAYSFLWLVVVSRFLTDVRGKLIRKINYALIIAYITSTIIVITLVPNLYDPILYTFNAIITVLLLICTVFGILEIRFERKQVFTIPMILISIALAVEGVFEIVSDQYNEGIANMYALVWSFSSICILYAVMKESKNLKASKSDEVIIQRTETEVIEMLKQEYSLTERETELIGLILQGMSNSEIAEALFIGGATVKTHIHNILTKMELGKKTDIIVLVKERMTK